MPPSPNTITEAQIQAFLEDPETKSIADQVLKPESPFEVQSNGQIVQIHDYCGWEAYYWHDAFMALIAHKGRIGSVDSSAMLTEIPELEQVDEFAE